MLNQCPNCGNPQATVISDYRLNVNYDQRYFGSAKIVRCGSCDLCFARPMPSGESLADFYGNVYRDVGRPHFADPKNPPLPSDRHFSYLSTLTSEIDMHNVHTILEIGPGSGEIGLLLLTIFPDLKIYCLEPDEHSQQVLRDRGYTPVSSASQIRGDVDLVMAFHSLEHFTSIDDFFSLFDEKLKPGGNIYLEVPNCPFGDGFDERPYDSPHLLFFTVKTLTDAATRRNLRTIDICTTGHLFAEEFKLTRDEQSIYKDWTPGSRNSKNVKAIVKSLLPERVRTLAVGLLRSNSPESFRFNAYHHLHNHPDSWLIRAIFQK